MKGRNVGDMMWVTPPEARSPPHVGRKGSREVLGGGGSCSLLLLCLGQRISNRIFVQVYVQKKTDKHVSISLNLVLVK